MDNRENISEKAPLNSSADAQQNGGFVQGTSPYPYAGMNGSGPVKKSYRAADKYDKSSFGVILAMLLLFFCNLFSVFGYFFSGFINAALFAAMVIYCSVLLKRKNVKIHPSAFVPAIGGIILCSTFISNENGHLFPLIMVALIYLTASFLTKAVGAQLHSDSSWFYLTDLLHTFVFSPVVNFIPSLGSLFHGNRADKAAGKSVRSVRRKKGMWIALGIICGILILCIVLPLLLASDERFNGAVNDFFGSFGDTIRTIAENLTFNFFMMIIAMYFTAISTPLVFSSLWGFANGKTKSDNKDTSVKYSKLRRAPQAFVLSALGVVCAVYVVYTVFQLSYLFSAFSGRLPADSDILVSEYARQGFFELMKIGAVNFFLIAGTVFFAARKEEKLPVAVKALDVFLCLFTMLITAISVSKIVLYMNTYGLTVNRVLVFAADIIIFLTLLFVLLRLFIRSFPYMKLVAATVVIVLTVLGFVNINKLVADTNYRLYTEGKMQVIDLDVLADCGPDGFIYLCEIAQKEGADRDKAVFNAADYWYTNFTDPMNDGAATDKIIRLANLSDLRALRYAKQHSDFMENVLKPEWEEFINDGYLYED